MFARVVPKEGFRYLYILKRGVKDARLQNFFDKSLTGPFDTILLLMNGSGIIGKQENLPAFFHRLKEVLARDGQLLLDSSDLSYLFEDEDGNLDIAPLILLYCIRKSISPK